MQFSFNIGLAQVGAVLDMVGETHVALNAKLRRRPDHREAGDYRRRHLRGHACRERQGAQSQARRVRAARPLTEARIRPPLRHDWAAGYGLARCGVSCSVPSSLYSVHVPTGSPRLPLRAPQ